MLAMDQEGEIITHALYDEWGKPLTEARLDGNFAGIDNINNYTGYTYDYLLDIYFAQNRFYNPDTRQFITQDPIKDGMNWYGYCEGNPLVNVDWFGQKPTVMEAALMAEHVYKYDAIVSKKEDRIVKNDEEEHTPWRLIDQKTEGSLKIGVYIKIRDTRHDDDNDWKNPVEYALVIKGTGLLSSEDWINNGAEYMDDYSSSEHMKSIMIYVNDFMKSKKGYDITIVGHSKGGGEAGVVATLFGIEAIVFNPSVPNIAWRLVDSGIESYVVEGEILNSIFGEMPIGETIYLPKQYGNESTGISMGIALDMANNHKIASVISALKEAGYN